MNINKHSLNDHSRCVSITSHYANGWWYKWICGFGLYELMVVSFFDATVSKHW